MFSLREALVDRMGDAYSRLLRGTLHSRNYVLLHVELPVLQEFEELVCRREETLREQMLLLHQAAWDLVRAGDFSERDPLQSL